MFAFLYESSVGKFVIFLVCALLAYLVYRLVNFFFGKTDNGMVYGSLVLSTPLGSDTLLTTLLDIAFRDASLVLTNVDIEDYGASNYKMTNGQSGTLYKYVIYCSFSGNIRRSQYALLNGLYWGSAVFEGLKGFQITERNVNNGNSEDP